MKNWYLIETTTDTYETKLKATDRDAAVKEAVETFKALSAHDQKRITDYWIGFGEPDEDGIFNYDEFADVVDILDVIKEHEKFEAAVALMDDELREEVHADLAPYSDEEFLAEYCRRHEERFGEVFEW